MSYHSLSECTLTPAERLEEAGRIISMITARSESYDQLTTAERRLVESMESSCSIKQLFWLRDIKDRVL